MSKNKNNNDLQAYEDQRIRQSADTFALLSLVAIVPLLGIGMHLVGIPYVLILPILLFGGLWLLEKLGDLFYKSLKG